MTYLKQHTEYFDFPLDLTVPCKTDCLLSCPLYPGSMVRSMPWSLIEGSIVMQTDYFAVMPSIGWVKVLSRHSPSDERWIYCHPFLPWAALTLIVVMTFTESLNEVYPGFCELSLSLPWMAEWLPTSRLSRQQNFKIEHDFLGRRPNGFLGLT